MRVRQGRVISDQLLIQRRLDSRPNEAVEKERRDEEANYQDNKEAADSVSNAPAVTVESHSEPSRKRTRGLQFSSEAREHLFGD